MAVDAEPKANEDAKENVPVMIIDSKYEFSAPRFYDFIDGETEEDERRAELWFDNALSYFPSPYMSRVKTGRSKKVEALCDFSEAEPSQKEMESDGTTKCLEGQLQSESIAATSNETVVSKSSSVDLPTNRATLPENQGKIDSPDAGPGASDFKTKQLEVSSGEKVSVEPPHQGVEGVSTPKPQAISKEESAAAGSKNRMTAQKIANLIKNPSALNHRNPLQSSQAKCKMMLKTKTAKRDINNKDASATLNLAHENQAVKRQKLDGGMSRQILNVKPQILPHKSKFGISSNKPGLCSSAGTIKTPKDGRKMYIREPLAPFVSTAEMIKKFQSSTRGLSMPFCSIPQGKPKLTLTRPKEPEFETAQRVRLVKAKSSADIEEEMMAKIPKFKARPLNKKILDAPTLPAPQRSESKLPEFQEFHFETMERANRNAESASVATLVMTHQTHECKPHLTEPRAPTLLTSLRARPSTVKRSVEVEQEELEKAPKFKARPLNKKIFESKGNVGMFCNEKKLITIPQEFHFATDERFPPPAAMCDTFDKLSLKSGPQEENPVPKNTAPNPFLLHTEERGAEKERKFKTELMQKHLEEERARIPKASPYPYTTDFPVVPPKPEPKHSTKPEPFQLESLVRHEEEFHKEMKERKRMEREEAETSIFKAQPILKDRDPFPVPEKVRRPLTQVQEFNLQSDHRAVDRSEYDQKIKEKEMVYKRHREEIETAKMMEEEKAQKQLRRTLVHHSRPVPNFGHPFHPQKCLKETTIAKSPKLRVLRRNAIAANYSGFSTVATNMR